MASVGFPLVRRFSLVIEGVRALFQAVYVVVGSVAIGLSFHVVHEPLLGREVKFSYACNDIVPQFLRFNPGKGAELVRTAPNRV